MRSPSSTPLLLLALATAFGTTAASAQPIPTPMAVALHVGPLLELADPDVPVGTCQVEVDCPESVGFGEEVLCQVVVLQKVRDEQGDIDFVERTIPRTVWRRNGRRAFAWQVDVSRLLPGGRCLLSRSEEPFTLNNRFRLTADFCPGSLWVGARPVRFFATHRHASVPFACEIPAAQSEPICNLLRDLDARDGSERLAEELGCTGELLIKACRVAILCPAPTPPIVPPTPTPRRVPTPSPPPSSTPAPSPTPTWTPGPPPTPTLPVVVPTPTPTPIPTPTSPIFNDPARIVRRDNGLHSVEMHGRIEVDVETFDPNASGLTWTLFIDGQPLVQFDLPPGAFTDRAGDDFSYRGDAARSQGGLQSFNFHTVNNGSLSKAVRMKGYSASLEPIVSLPAEVTSVPAQIVLTIPGWGTFSATGTMKRNRGGQVWHMSFPRYGSLLEP